MATVTIDTNDQRLIAMLVAIFDNKTIYPIAFKGDHPIDAINIDGQTSIDYYRRQQPTRQRVGRRPFTLYGDDVR